MAQPQDKPQHTKGKNSTFTKKKNQNADIPMSAGKIKKRIRDVKRTLSKGNQTSAQVITESKRRLRALEFELGEKIVDEYERGNATKYHAVKHFERKKSERKLKQAQKQLEAATDEDNKQALEEKVKECEIKVQYVLHYPKTHTYVSLYPKENEDDEKSLKRKNAILQDIKEAMEKNDTNFKQMNKKYRDAYKQKLIQKGLIQPDAPVDEDVEIKEVKEEEEGSSDDSSDEKDDFFQKA